MNASRVSPAEAARGVWRERYAGARVMFLAGSVMRGEATPTSDLDVVVVFEKLPGAYRESFTSGGWPVEAFVNDVETLRHFFGVGRERGLPSLLRMVIEGVEVPEACEFSEGLKREASEIYEAGPVAFDDVELQLRRYRLTDWVDDIRFPRSDEELVASGAWLYRDAADFFFRSRGLWSAHSKTIPRRMRETDAEFAATFLAAFEALFKEKRGAAAIALVEELLAPFGGTLFDGFRMDAASRENLRVTSDE
jgi:predicted nucleotidyltransferase